MAVSAENYCRASSEAYPRIGYGRAIYARNRPDPLSWVSKPIAGGKRKDLDALRGSFHRFGAVRGTIIAMSKYSKGTRDAAFESGAAPITLIDGEKLIELLLAHGIGVRKKTLEVLELDAGAFAEVEESLGDQGDDLRTQEDRGDD